jgi:tetratricopeptide (TPR) repeat protein
MRGYAYASLAIKQEGNEAQPNFEKAENDYLEALKLKKDYMLVHCYLGVLYGTQSRWQEAERAFKQAIKLQPRYSGAYHDLGAIYVLSGRPHLALKAFEKAVEYGPKNLLSLRYLGEAYYKAERWEDAKKILLRVLRLDPEDARTLHNLAIAYLHLDDLQKAEKTLRKTLELDPEDALAYNNLGFIYLKTGRPVESAAAYNKALDLDPDSETTKNSLRTLQSMMLMAVVDTYLDALADEDGLNIDGLIDDLALTEAVLSADGMYLWRTPTLFFPRELVYTLTPLVRRLDKDSRFLLAAKLFEHRLLSSGTASRLIGADRVTFLLNLRNIGMTITNIGTDELEDEACRLEAETLTASLVWRRFRNEARRHQQDPVDFLTGYMNERLEVWEDEALDEQISRDLRRSGYREEDAVEIVRQYRREKKDQRAAT